MLQYILRSLNSYTSTNKVSYNKCKSSTISAPQGYIQASDCIKNVNYLLHQSNVRCTLISLRIKDAQCYIYSYTANCSLSTDGIKKAIKNQYSISINQLPYNGYHSRKKTFTNFMDFGMIANVFLLPSSIS